MKMQTTNSRILILLSAALIMAAVGCTKKNVAKNTPPAPQAAAQAAPAAPQQAPTQPQQQAASNNVTPRTPDAKTQARIDQLLARIEDAYFDYNQHALRPAAIQA